CPISPATRRAVEVDVHRSAVGGEPAPCPAVPVGGPENVAVVANTIPAVESHAALVPDVIREESQVAAPTVQDFRRSCFAHGSGRHPLLHPAASWIAGRRSVPGVTEDRLVVLPLSTRSMRCEWPGSRLARLPHASSESRVEARRVRPARSQAPSAIRATTAMSSWYAPRAIPSRGPARSLAAGQRRISAISRPLI